MSVPRVMVHPVMHFLIPFQDDGHDKKHHSKKQLDWALSYEEMQARLECERKKTHQLNEDLRAAKSDGDRIKSACKEVAKKPPQMAQTNHNIPHRFQKQTNLRTPKVKGGKGGSMKCAVCTTSIAFGRTASVCKFCNRTVHPACEAHAPKDCGLSNDLAMVLKSRDGIHQNFYNFSIFFLNRL
jgi:hypothetical protein